MLRIDVSPDKFVPNLLSASRDVGLCLLDSCGDKHAGSHRLIAGMFPVETLELRGRTVAETLNSLDEELTGDKAAIFSLSYDFARRLHDLEDVKNDHSNEPDVFISTFDSLLVHDYSTGETLLTGNADRFAEIASVVERVPVAALGSSDLIDVVSSNFTRTHYLDAIETIKEHIRSGNTYQTNLTQQLSVSMAGDRSTKNIFQRIRREHPAPFAAFLERKDSTVISASPERFFKVEEDQIFASPIKGTRPRGADQRSDERLRIELLESEKDRAENTMIVDLLRNDLGRICEFGSVQVKELCKLQELPTLFHLESTIEGRLRANTKPSQMICALFPCGSITGAPKLRTMRIIDQLEPVPRGLSMGAIGVYIPKGFGMPPMLDLSVAIRTMVIRDDRATFNVGGGIVIDSDPEKEYEESLIKAQALLSSLGFNDTNKKLTLPRNISTSNAV